MYRYQEKKKSHEALDKAYSELTDAHRKLKNAQDQLVHAEKMASLGQMTAGIAHEIQNPLNFVNNFSESSMELLQEMAEAKNAEEREMILEIYNSICQKLSSMANVRTALSKTCCNTVGPLPEKSRPVTSINWLKNISILLSTGCVQRIPVSPVP
ncbi:MAG: hypothetical protein IPP38_10075 [Bacteroidetes bacterium]|nr:hypothetical protein [Bacteroidota bacterium]